MRVAYEFFCVRYLQRWQKSDSAWVLELGHLSSTQKYWTNNMVVGGGEGLVALCFPNFKIWVCTFIQLFFKGENTFFYFWIRTSSFLQPIPPAENVKMVCYTMYVYVYVYVSYFTLLFLCVCVSTTLVICAQFQQFILWAELLRMYVFFFSSSITECQTYIKVGYSVG